MPHHFAINCNKYYINKSNLVQIAQIWGQIKIPRVGMQLMIKYPTYAPPPSGGWGLTLRGALHFGIQNVELYSTTIYIFMILQYNKPSRYNNQAL
jgi:hypothetical protein